jgi:hypothetical protein
MLKSLDPVICQMVAHDPLWIVLLVFDGDQI